ncbi:hypothetical protein GUITHDRAFT_151128 [Guillardia theta CCMP2712]|uniref:Uncharacterized protein n=1 Tax=Guillardia theta (strain CCMP2712) TaxID=905079 RepID=L1JS39_GUITC|nr:hypothetical protein GUITHDRAFT_151128 [Guillardia theta CCMP2712]EKX51005.1 hypothetical protein GUITHDRAFT_151128 [Guillardia theta CCMP2712]|eukprot:XP_005837985.1 hypothetical protein GUITHDRAFT_151128 [Guillardia theta CCMP2712]
MAQVITDKIQTIKESITLCTELIENSFSDVIAAMHEAKCSEEETREVMTYAQMISEDKKRLQLLENQIVQASQMQEDSPLKTKFLEQLKNSTFGVEESKMAYKSCGSYASLESKFQSLYGEAGEDEDLCMTAEDLPESDPLTTERLAFKDGKWPLALPCKHVYNYSTVFALKSKSKTFALDKCVVSACSNKTPIGGMEAREKLQPDTRVMQMIRKRQKYGDSYGNEERECMEL